MKKIMIFSVCLVLVFETAGAQIPSKTLIQSNRLAVDPDAILLVQNNTVGEPNNLQKKSEGNKNTAGGEGVGLMVAGGIGIAAGLGLSISGYNENQSAGDVPGCTKSGSSVICLDDESTNEAQDKIDSGEKNMALGVLVAAAGGGLLTWGILRSARAKKERRRAQSNLQLEYEPQDHGAVVLSYQIPF